MWFMFMGLIICIQYKHGPIQKYVLIELKIMTLMVRYLINKLDKSLYAKMTS